MSAITFSHLTLSASINRILTYCESNNVDVTGISSAIIAGVCIGLSTVIVLTRYPGQPLGIYDQQHDETDSPTDNIAEQDPLSDDSIRSEIQNFSDLPGISKAQLTRILASLRQQQDKRKIRSKNLEDDSMSIFTIIKLFIMAGFLSCFVYILNRDYNDSVTIWFVRTFPRESSTLGLSLHDEF